MKGNEGPSENESRPANEKSGNEEFKASPSSQVEISWPQVAKENALLLILSFAKRDLLECHGGSTSQRRRTRELVKENKGPIKHAA